MSEHERELKELLQLAVDCFIRHEGKKTDVYATYTNRSDDAWSTIREIAIEYMKIDPPVVSRLRTLEKLRR